VFDLFGDGDGFDGAYPVFERWKPLVILEDRRVEEKRGLAGFGLRSQSARRLRGRMLLE